MRCNQCLPWCYGFCVILIHLFIYLYVGIYSSTLHVTLFSLLQRGKRASFNTYVDIILFGSGLLTSSINIQSFHVHFFVPFHLPYCWKTFLLQHYDRCGQYDIALIKIDEAIEHTPTVIDLYSVKVYLLIYFIKIFSNLS